MNKKVTAVLCSLMIFGNIPVSADSVDFVRENMDTQTVNIKGSGIMPKDIVLIRISDKATGKIEAVFPVNAEDDGSYEFTFSADEYAVRSGRKMLYAKPQNSEPAESEFLYSTLTDISELIHNWNRAVSTKDVSVMENIVQSAETVGIILNSDITDEIVSNVSEIDKTALCTALCGSQEADSVSEIRSQFEKEYLSFVLNNSDRAFKIKLLDNFVLSFIPDDNEIYSGLLANMASNIQEEVFIASADEIIKSGRELSYNEIQNILYESVIITGLRQINYYPEVKPFIEKYNEYFKVDFSNYNLLKDKRSVDTQIINNKNKYSSFKNFKEYYEGMINAALKKEKSQIDEEDGENRRGGGTSGRLPTSYIPAYVESEDDAVNMHINEVIFEDLEGFEWAKDSIMNLYNNGAADGSGNKRFEPGRTVTREEFVKMVLSIIDKDNITLEECNFTDADKDAWYYDYLVLAKSAGIVSGKDDGSFGIGEYITRQDMAVMCINALNIKKPAALSQIKGARLEFADTDNISNYAFYAVSSLQKLGVINGFEDNTFRPGSYASRAEAAVIISRILGL